MQAFFQQRQRAPCLGDHRPGQASQRRHLQAEAAVGRAILDRVQKHQLLAVLLIVQLDRVQVHIGDARQFGRQFGELEIVRGEQRPGAAVAGQMHGGGARQRQAVVGAGAPADLVHQHQAVLGGVVQDVGRLAHLHHEGGLPAREVVAGADAGEDAVDRPDYRACRRHVAADVGEQHDQRVLPHVGAFAAHVRAGDHQHAAGALRRRVAQLQVVRLERLLAYFFHHRVAAAFDLDAGLVAQLRCAPVQRLGAFGQRAQHVELGHRGGGGLQRRQPSGQRVEQRLVQRALAHQRALLGGEHLVLEVFQFLGDVALGVLGRLPARVVGGRLVGLCAADLDVVAVHAVVADLQCGDAAGGLFALFQLDQILVGVGRQPAQLVQLGVVAVGDHAAVALHRRRLRHHRLRQQRGAVGVIADALDQRVQQRAVQRGDLFAQHRGRGEPVAQGGKVTRTRRAQCHAGENALQVADAAQLFAQRLAATLVEQHGDRLMALAQHRARAQRPVQPAAQQTRAHRRHALVEHAEQGVLGAPAGMRVDLQVAPRGGIQRDGVGSALHRHAGEVRQRALLGFLDVAEQAAGGGHRQRQLIHAEAAQIAGAEKAVQLAPRGVAVEMPGRPLAQAGQAADQPRPGDAFVHQRLGRLQPRQLGRQRLGVRRFADQKAAAGQIHPGQPVRAASTRGDGQQQVVAAILQQRRVGQRARCHDAHHLSLDDALGQRRVTDLLADRHRFTQAYQSRQVAFHRVVRHTGHRNRRAGRLPALGQRDVEQPRRLARVVVEQFVEITHAEKQQHLRMFGLGGEVLAHEGRVACARAIRARRVDVDQWPVQFVA